MKILKRILLALLGLVFLVAVGVYVFLKTTAPNYSGTVAIDGLTSEVVVRYDAYGVPHIQASNAEDAYFALGYVHAQDRLFQMEMLRRAAGGRLAEVLGKDLINTDRYFRTMGISQFAREHARMYLGADTADFQRAAHAYQKGVNEYVRNGKTPIEFSLIGIPKTEFSDEDMYLAMGFVSLGFAEGLSIDPVLEKIRNQLGEPYLRNLAVQTPPTAVRIRNFSGQVAAHHDSLIAGWQDALKKVPVPLWMGSNGWVISGSRTKSGKPILANDTHMGYSQPQVWYEAHLEYPGFSLYGHHLAGVPFAFLGNNRYCGWGLTMFENDDTDFYYETLNPDDANQVQYKGQWTDIKVREEIIKVKGETDFVFPVKSTPHGPIINDIKSDLVDTATPVSLWWLLNHHTNEGLQAAYQLNHAASFEQAEKAASMFSSPGLNLMYGDIDGNAAWWAVAKLPIRPPHVNSKFFLDGASGNDEVLGYYEFSKNPHALNPPWGFTYSANNQPDSVDGILYPGYYYPRSRAGRIVELLSEEKKWTPEDVKKVNLDVVSKMHMDLAKEMADQLRQLKRDDLNDIITALSNWNGDHQKTDIVPSIYYNLLGNIFSLAMKDELGEKAYYAILKSSLMKNSFDLLLKDENAPWWDDVRTTDKKETRSAILAAALERTLRNLRQTSGPVFTDWTWDKVHTITNPHPLAVVKPLDRFFNVGPLPAPGGSEVLNNLHFTIDTTGYFPADGGPALRKITDFADVEHGQTVSPSGQSGNRMSAHYSDQAEMYVNGEFRLMMMNRDEIKLQASSTLIMQPKTKP